MHDSVMTHNDVEDGFGSKPMSPATQEDLLGSNSKAKAGASSVILSILRRLSSAWSWRSNVESIWKRSSRARTYVLDGLRAFSVLWVIAFHVMTTVILEGLSPLISSMISFWPAQVILNGDMGVDVFFVLSGYLIGRILLKDLVRGFESHGRAGTCSTLCTFFLRRWLRIFPMLVTAIVATIISVQISLQINNGKGFAVYDMAGESCLDFGQVWPMLIFVNNYISDFHCMIQTWSVAVEVQMYLLSPLVIWMAYSFKQRKRRQYCYLMLFLLSTLNIGFNALHVYYVQGGKLFFFIPHTMPDSNGLLSLGYVATWCRFSPYISGMTIALMERNFGDRERKRKPSFLAGNVYLLTAADAIVCFTTGTLLFLGCGTNYLTYETSRVLAYVLALGGRWLFGWCIAYLIFMCNNGRLNFLRVVFELNVWYSIAVLSYGTYLLQMIWIIFVKGVDQFKAISPIQSLWVSFSVFSWDFTVATLFTLLSAAITYLLVEKPFMNLRPTFTMSSK